MSIYQEIQIALRYFSARNANAFIVVVSRLSMIGISLGVATLIVVLAVMNGFERELRQRILNFSAHVVMLPYLTYRDQWQTTLDHLNDLEQVEAISPFVRREVVIAEYGELTGAVLYGIDPELEERARKFSEQLTRGDLKDLQAGEFGIIIGQKLAEDLYLSVGDKLTVMSPVIQRNIFTVAPRSKRFVVQAIFSSGMNAFDQGYLYAHQSDVNTLLGKDRSRISGLRLYLRDVDRAPELARQLKQKYGTDYQIRNWTEENQSFFRAIEIEKRVMAVILTLIIAVAVFNVVSSLVMLVSEKRADIAILRAMGLNRRSILRIFIWLSAIIGLLGTIAGVLLGLVLAYNVESIVAGLEDLFGTQVLVAEVYIIDKVPSDPQWQQVVLLACVSMGLSLIASIYPAWQAANTKPGKILRYE